MKSQLIPLFGPLVVTATLLVVVSEGFYLEEDWRGARAWSEARAEIEKAGVNLDRQAYVAAPIPDSENLAAIPLLQSTESPEYPYSWHATHLEDALKVVLPHLAMTAEESTAPGSFPKLTPGVTPDLDVIRQRAIALGHAADPPISISDDVSTAEAFDRLCPALAQLRSENARRSGCVFPRVFDRNPPHALSLGPVTSLISLNRVLVYEERVALADKNSTLALDDMDVMWKLVDGSRKQATLVSGLVTSALIQMQIRVIEEALEQHVFNNAQLQRIETQFARIDLIKDSQFWIAGEEVDYDMPYMEYFRQHRFVTTEQLNILRGQFLSDEPKATWVSQVLFVLTPGGWFAQDDAFYARVRLMGLRHVLDPAAHRVHPDEAETEKHLLQHHYNYVFWDVPMSRGNSLLSDTTKSFAFGQSQVDEGRIAVALERYRLAHGSLPPTLGALEEPLPCDPLSGHSYIYRLSPDGTYVLYSVAWNQIDDGGQGTGAGVALKDSPDWIWGDSR